MHAFIQRRFAHLVGVDAPQPERFSAERTKLFTIASVIWEAPPLVPLGSHVYDHVRGYMHQRLYEGPSKWEQKHTDVALASTKAALLNQTTVIYIC